MKPTRLEPRHVARVLVTCRSAPARHVDARRLVFEAVPLTLAAVCLVIAACTPSTTAPPPPPIDAGAGVCGHLASVGCPQPPACARVFDTAQGKLTDFHVGCLLAARSAREVEACGSVLCLDAGP